MSSTSSSTTLVPPSPPLHSPSNTKQINTMKSECCQIFATCCYIPGVCAGVPGQCRITVLVWNVLSKYDFITSITRQSFSFLGLWVCLTIHTFSEADFMTQMLIRRDGKEGRIFLIKEYFVRHLVCELFKCSLTAPASHWIGWPKNCLKINHLIVHVLQFSIYTDFFLKLK